MSFRIVILPILLAGLIILLMTLLGVSRGAKAIRDMRLDGAQEPGGPYTWDSWQATRWPGGWRGINTHTARTHFGFEEPQARHSAPPAPGHVDTLVIYQDGQVEVAADLIPRGDTARLAAALAIARTAAAIQDQPSVLYVCRACPWRTTCDVIQVLDAPSAAHAFRVTSWPRGDRRLFHFRYERPLGDAGLPTGPAEVRLSLFEGLLRNEVDLEIGAARVRVSSFIGQKRNNDAWQRVADAIGALPQGPAEGASCVVQVDEGVPTGAIVTLLDLLIEFGRTERIVFPAEEMMLHLDPPKTPQGPPPLIPCVPLAPGTGITAVFLGLLALWITTRGGPR